MLIEHLAKNLIITPDYIKTVANTASKRYISIEIPKKSGGLRKIHNPSRELKTLQRVIHEDILERLPTHPCAHAYKKGSSILQHAKQHKDAKYLLRLDFKDFFESIKHSDIELYITKNISNHFPNWEPEDTSLLLKLICHEYKLSIGAVTSPAISNAICFEMDEKINSLCLSSNIKYTRYADDLYFSCKEKEILPKIPPLIKDIIRNLEYPKSLWLNIKKTIHTSHKRKVNVTGLTITNSGNVSLGRERKRKIKSLIYKWDILSKDEKNSLQGMLAFCASVEPAFINSLCIKYGSQKISDAIKFKHP